MPTYKFLDKKSGKEHIEFMKISELDPYLEANPHIEQLVHGAPSIGDAIRIGVGQKPDEGFRDILRRIKKNNHGSKLNIM